MSKIPVGEGFLFPDGTNQESAGVVPNDGQRVYVSKGGSNSDPSITGLTEELPKLTIVGALGVAMATGATAITVGKGTYDETVLAEDGVDLDGDRASLFSTGDSEVSLIGANSQQNRFGFLGASGDNSVVYVIDGIARNVLDISTLAMGGFGPVATLGISGIVISGENDDVIIKALNCVNNADNSTLVDLTGESDTAISITLGNLTNTGDGFTGIKSNSSSASQITNINFDTVVDTSDGGTIFCRGNVGNVVIRGSNVIMPDQMFVLAEAGLRVDVSIAQLDGNIHVESGGNLSLSKLGLMLGGLTLDTGSSTFGSISNMTGDLTIEASATFNGDIGVASGTIDISPLANVNGVINGVRYGNRVIKKVAILDAFSLAANQQPPGLGTANAIQVEFGIAQNSASDPVSLDADGTININQAGTYRIKVSIQFGRTGSSSFSAVLFRTLVDGVQSGLTVSSKLDKGSTLQYTEVDSWVKVDEPKTITFEIMRDALGSDEGGLFEFDPTVDGGNEWDCSPSAAINIIRLV